MLLEILDSKKAFSGTVSVHHLEVTIFQVTVTMYLYDKFNISLSLGGTVLIALTIGVVIGSTISGIPPLFVKITVELEPP